MRVYVELTPDAKASEESYEGVLALKNESHLILKVDNIPQVQIFHWSDISKAFSIAKGEKTPINLDNFRKIRE